MLEFPAIQDLLVKTRHKDLIRVLERRFGSISQEIVAGVQAIRDTKNIDELFAHAITCADLESFKSHLQ